MAVVGASIFAVSQAGPSLGLTCLFHCLRDLDPRAVSCCDSHRRFLQNVHAAAAIAAFLCACDSVSVGSSQSFGYIAIVVSLQQVLFAAGGALALRTVRRADT